MNESSNGLSNVAETIAMARASAPDSATSQFFINLVDNLGLNYGGSSSPGYAVFGRVTSDPVAIDCGATCSFSQPAGPAIQLNATPAAGYVFGGWLGDCKGLRRTINLDTSKGNHNCTAQFSKSGPLNQ